MKREALKEGLLDWELERAEPGLFQFFPEREIRRAVERLLEDGVDVDPTITARPWEGGNALLIAEAVNWAAKVVCESYYDLKAYVFCAAAMMAGVEHGWEDGVFYIRAEGFAEVSAHDPWGEIMVMAEQLGLTRHWPHGWSGISRQPLSFTALRSRAVRRFLARAQAGEWGPEQVSRVARRLQ